MLQITYKDLLREAATPTVGPEIPKALKALNELGIRKLQTNPEP